MRIRIHFEVCEGDGRICRFDPDLTTLDELIATIATKLLKSEGHENTNAASREYDLTLQGCMIIKDVRAMEKDDHIVLVRKEIITIADEDEVKDETDAAAIVNHDDGELKMESKNVTTEQEPKSPTLPPVVTPMAIKSTSLREESKPEVLVRSSLFAPAAGTLSPPSKRVKLEVKVEDGFGTKKRPSFSKESFLSENILHLNSFVTQKTSTNIGFGPFIATGIASPGFHPIGPEVTNMLRVYGGISTSRTAVVKEIMNTTENDEPSWAQQLGTWLQCATEPGCFIVMRHEYRNCQFLPSALKDNSGNFVGPVYVIGQVTMAGLIHSNEWESLQRDLYQSFPAMYWDSNSPVRVHWKWMGLKSNLQESTQRYLNCICQPTVSQICGIGKEWPRLGTDWRVVREDLWMNATTPINASAFFS